MAFNSTNTLGTVFFYIGLGFFCFAAALFLLSFWRSSTKKQRTYSNNSLIIVCIAATAYLAMAMGTGYVIRPGGRWIYWARYVDWVFTTPLLIYDLGNFAGVGLNQILMAMFFDVLMILMGLFGALTHAESRRWVWYGMGCLAFAPIAYLILFNWRKYLRAETSKAYTVQSFLLFGLWLIYPIAWGLGTGGEKISNDAETVWITILDILAKAAYGCVWVFLFRSHLPYAEGEIADRVAQAPRHPNELAPLTGEPPVRDQHVYMAKLLHAHTPMNTMNTTAAPVAAAI